MTLMFLLVSSYLTVSSAFLLREIAEDSNERSFFFLLSSVKAKHFSSNPLIIFWTSCIYPAMSFISKSTIHFCWSFACCCFLPSFLQVAPIPLSSIFNMLQNFARYIQSEVITCQKEGDLWLINEIELSVLSCF